MDRYMDRPSAWGNRRAGVKASGRLLIKRLNDAKNVGKYRNMQILARPFIGCHESRSKID